MKSKNQNQSTLMKIMKAPIRVLGKARDLYIKSITGCAARASVSYPMTPNGNLPKSYSIGSAMSLSDYGDDYSELIRAASVRSLGHKNEIDMLLQQQKQEQQLKLQQKLPKSVSVGMNFMGRIEEEKGEDEGSVNGGNKGKNNNGKIDFYPRSRSYVVADRSVVAL